MCMCNMYFMKDVIGRVEEDCSVKGSNLGLKISYT